MAAIGREGGESRSRASRAARDGNGGALSDRELTRPVSRDGDGRADDRADFGGGRSASRDEARL
jgi:hypothetical protein